MKEKILVSVGKFLRNRVILYLFSRYFTYFIQFLTSVIIAVKLGPYYFGIWGFLLLLINYFQVTNFGISNAANVLLVQHKNDDRKVKDLVATCLLCVGIVCCFILLLTLYYRLFGIALFDKYKVGNLFYGVSIIAIIAHFNILLMTIYRIRNRLFELSFYQSVIPFLTFIASLLLTGETLLYSLLSAYLVGNLMSLFIFYIKKMIPLGGTPNITDLKLIIHKGFFLFVYNLCFYLIIISIKTIVSVSFSVEQFGYFSFSYTVSNAILLLLQALTFIIFPKVLDRLSLGESQNVEKLIKQIRESYVSLAFGLVLIALFVFPFFMQLTSKYQEALVALQLTTLTVVLYTNSFGYGAYLMARNKEKALALIAAISLFVNICIALILVRVVKVDFTYVILATMFSYILYSLLFVIYAKRLLNSNRGFMNSFNDCFPPSLLLPYILAVFIVITETQVLTPLPFILYVILNKRGLMAAIEKMKLLINKPNIVDL